MSVDGDHHVRRLDHRIGVLPSGEAQFVNRLFAVYRSDSPWWQDWSTPAQKAADAAYTKRVYADFYDPGFVKVMDDNDTLASAQRCEAQAIAGAVHQVHSPALAALSSARARQG